MIFYLLILLAIIPLWALVSPRSMWWTLSGWRYRNPDANEPSDTAYVMSRVVGLIALVGLGVAGALVVADQRGVAQVQDCETQLRPQFVAVWRDESGEVDEAAVRTFASEHGLTATVDTLQTGPATLTTVDLADGEDSVLTAVDSDSDASGTEPDVSCASR